jgi:hypothetical protein
MMLQAMVYTYSVYGGKDTEGTATAGNQTVASVIACTTPFISTSTF